MGEVEYRHRRSAGTKVKGRGQERIRIWFPSWSGMDNRERATTGVSIAIQGKHKRRLLFYEMVSERVIRLDLRIFCFNVSILGIYSPNNNKLATEKDLFDVI